jgi:hypothetical protein
MGSTKLDIYVFIADKARFMKGGIGEVVEMWSKKFPCNTPIKVLLIMSFCKWSCFKQGAGHFTQEQFALVQS